MNIDPILVAGVVVLTVLAVLLTGPGMWSEKWGWRWFGDRKRGDGPRPGAGPDPR